MKKFIRIMDILFIIFLFFVLSKAWFSFRSNGNQSTLYAITATALFTVILLFFVKKYTLRKEAKVLLQKELEVLKQTLLMRPEKEYFSLFNKIVKADYPAALRLSKALYLAESALIIVVPQEKREPYRLNITAIIKAMNCFRANELVVYSPFNEEVFSAQPLYITPKRLSDIHATLKANEIELELYPFPEIKPPRTSLIQQFKATLHTTSPVKYIFYATLFMTAAFSGRYGIYYMLIALCYGVLGLISYGMKYKFAAH